MADVTKDVLYRYQETRYAAPVNEWGDPQGSGRMEVRLYYFDVLKRTPKGAWITDRHSQKRFVLLTASKRYACNTVDEARESLLARKRRQINIMRRRIADAEEAMRIISGKMPWEKVA